MVTAMARPWPAGGREDGNLHAGAYGGLTMQQSPVAVPTLLAAPRQFFHKGNHHHLQQLMGTQQ